MIKDHDAIAPQYKTYLVQESLENAPFFTWVQV